MRNISRVFVTGCLLTAVGCSSSEPAATPKPGDTTAKDSGGKASAPKPVFSLEWSEYPSWSVFGVADEYELVDGRKGYLDTLEMKWGVDIELKEASYEACLNHYGTGNCDAVCVTNMDALTPSLGRASVAVMPTSTSNGADACIVVGINSPEELRKHKVYGLKGTVSEYCFARNLELAGEKEADHQFENMDPAAAAVAMQQKNPEQQAIMVWNPFVLQTLKMRKDAKVLFDSEKIPGEIVDMVVVAEKSLQKPGGKEFVMCVMDVFYEFNKIMADESRRDTALVDLGKKFSNLNAEEMKKATVQTKFYSTPDEALGLFKSEEFPKTMTKVVQFCVDHGIVEKGKEPKVIFGAGAGNLRIDPTYLEEFKAGKK